MIEKKRRTISEQRKESNRLAAQRYRVKHKSQNELLNIHLKDLQQQHHGLECKVQDRYGELQSVLQRNALLAEVLKQKGAKLQNISTSIEFDQTSPHIDGKSNPNRGIQISRTITTGAQVDGFAPTAHAQQLYTPPSFWKVASVDRIVQPGNSSFGTLPTTRLLSSEDMSAIPIAQPVPDQPASSVLTPALASQSSQELRSEQGQGTQTNHARPIGNSGSNSDCTTEFTDLEKQLNEDADMCEVHEDKTFIHSCMGSPVWKQKPYSPLSQFFDDF